MSRGPGATVRHLMEKRPYLLAAGAYDALSARIIGQCGFDLIYTSGFGISASRLGQPDAELYTMTENLEAVREMVQVAGVPVLADADTGYGNVVNVRRTVRSFETAGCAGVVLEDQVFPKRCPACVGAVETVSVGEAVGKIRAAIDARSDPQFLIVARTDAVGADAVERAKAYADAGADLITPISKAFDLAGLRALGQVSPKPLCLNVLGWLEREMGPEEFVAVRAKIVNFPLVPIQVAAAAVQAALAHLHGAHSVKALPVASMDLDEFRRLIGFPELEALHARYTDA